MSRKPTSNTSDDHYSQEVPVRNNPRLRTLIGRERPAERFSVCTDPILTLVGYRDTVWCWHAKKAFKAERLWGFIVQE